ncbi:uncharacterized protein BDR25DRAFT_347910 [Lindgomyces ingoldianus]|uniref:Uncharacterized protein n=1 Tax=Lindgomyces ingoldianus TaxID=673940 RepID=A0ACB6REL7_9PLEO|nr:uncharacterized protein BDR25DRAFT_347910 [Lindgomyces ingoldianus]KAF2477581.1 hypothetical protein BDR25DRAFT_347910 [Lindgomyces ingoldianus]
MYNTFQDDYLRQSCSNLQLPKQHDYFQVSLKITSMQKMTAYPRVSSLASVANAWAVPYENPTYGNEGLSSDTWPKSERSAKDMPSQTQGTENCCYLAQARLSVWLRDRLGESATPSHCLQFVRKYGYIEFAAGLKLQLASTGSAPSSSLPSRQIWAQFSASSHHLPFLVSPNNPFLLLWMNPVCAPKPRLALDAPPYVSLILPQLTQSRTLAEPHVPKKPRASYHILGVELNRSLTSDTCSNTEPYWKVVAPGEVALLPSNTCHWLSEAKSLLVLFCNHFKSATRENECTISIAPYLKANFKPKGWKMSKDMPPGSLQNHVERRSEFDSCLLFGSSKFKQSNAHNDATSSIALVGLRPAATTSHMEMSGLEPGRGSGSVYVIFFGNEMIFLQPASVVLNSSSRKGPCVLPILIYLVPMLLRFIL